MSCPDKSTRYLPKAVSPATLVKDKRTPIQQMASLRLFDTRFDCPTYAGILLLGHDPQYFIPGAYIQYVKFAGTNRATKVLKEKPLQGQSHLNAEGTGVFYQIFH